MIVELYGFPPPLNSPTPKHVVTALEPSELKTTVNVHHNILIRASATTFRPPHTDHRWQTDIGENRIL